MRKSSTCYGRDHGQVVVVGVSVRHYRRHQCAAEVDLTTAGQLTTMTTKWSLLAAGKTRKVEGADCRSIHVAYRSLLHTSNELGGFSRRLCHYYSTTNIVICIIIIAIWLRLSKNNNECV